MSYPETLQNVYNPILSLTNGIVERFIKSIYTIIRPPADMFFGVKPIDISSLPGRLADPEATSEFMTMDEIPPSGLEKLRIPLRINQPYHRRILFIETSDFGRFFRSLMHRWYEYPVDASAVSKILYQLMQKMESDILYIAVRRTASTKPTTPLLPKFITDPSGVRIRPTTVDCQNPANPRTIHVFSRNDALWSDVPPLRHQEQFLNRPPRLYYHLHHDGSLTQYCDRLIRNAQGQFEELSNMYVLVNPLRRPTGVPLWTSTSETLPPLIIDSPIDMVEILPPPEICLLQDEQSGLVGQQETETTSQFIRSLRNGLDEAHKMMRLQMEKHASNLQDRRPGSPPHSFEMGDRAWLSVPLSVSAQSTGLPEKFLYRWSGPVRVIAQHGGDSGSRYRVVCTYPGGEIIARDVHVSRLRPYTKRIPVDAPTPLADTDDFDAELQAWKSAVILRRGVRAHWQQHAVGTNPVLLERFDDMYVPQDKTDPEFLIERLISPLWNNEANQFEYRTRWQGWQKRHDSYQLETDLHPDLVAEFWDTYKKSDDPGYKKWRKWIRNSKKTTSDALEKPEDTPPKKTPKTKTRSLGATVAQPDPDRTQKPKPKDTKAKPLDASVTSPNVRRSARLHQRGQPALQSQRR